MTEFPTKRQTDFIMPRLAVNTKAQQRSVHGTSWTRAAVNLNVTPIFTRYTVFGLCSFYSFVCSFCTRWGVLCVYRPVHSLSHPSPAPPLSLLLTHSTKTILYSMCFNSCRAQHRHKPKNIWLYLVFALISIYVYATALLTRKYVIVPQLSPVLSFLSRLFQFSLTMAYKHAATTIESKVKREKQVKPSVLLHTYTAIRRKTTFVLWYFYSFYIVFYYFQYYYTFSPDWLSKIVGKYVDVVGVIHKI